MKITFRDVIDFWYSDRLKRLWFDANPELDKEILDKFSTLLDAAHQGKLEEWKLEPEACLALVFILDQFPLNMYRGQAKAFESGRKAVSTALHAVNQNFDKRIDIDKLSFLYMPFMHSENLAEQNMLVKLFGEAKLEKNLRFAEHHRAIIEQYGRFPHRNKILGRPSTEAEIQYLASKKAFQG